MKGRKTQKNVFYSLFSPCRKHIVEAEVKFKLTRGTCQDEPLKVSHNAKTTVLSLSLFFFFSLFAFKKENEEREEEEEERESSVFLEGRAALEERERERERERDGRLRD